MFCTGRDNQYGHYLPPRGLAANYSTSNRGAPVLMKMLLHCSQYHVCHIPLRPRWVTTTFTMHAQGVVQTRLSPLCKKARKISVCLRFLSFWVILKGRPTYNQSWLPAKLIASGAFGWPGVEMHKWELLITDIQGNKNISWMSRLSILSISGLDFLSFQSPSKAHPSQ